MERDSRGRIAQGASGNRRGRPPKAPRRLETPADLRAVVKRVANRPVTIQLDGKAAIVPQYEANVYILAMGGGGQRLGMKAFIEFVHQAYETSERVDRPRLAREAFGVTPPPGEDET
jgi:hypothetical protein